MRFIIDHDLHSHSYISPCSRDDRQTKQAIYAYALASGYRLMALTDHGWDSKVDDLGAPGWGGNTMDRLRENLPLPQSKYCRFIMGCEIDLNRYGVFGLSREEWDNFDFILTSITHLNLMHFTIDPDEIPATEQAHKEYYLARVHRLLDMKGLPFSKMGLAHFATINSPRINSVRCLTLFSDKDWQDMFEKFRQTGMGLELNFNPRGYDAEALEIVLHPHRIAKDMGCKFYLGGDAHHPERFAERKAEFETIVDLLNLQESDKWEFVPNMIAQSAKQ